MKIIVVTPAGRKAYLDLLSSYVLFDNEVSEWHLWDNCREESDRTYINDLAKLHKKIKIIKVSNVDGTNLSVNKFYKYCNESDVFYIKIDDDVVYVQNGTFAYMRNEAVKSRENYIWWSPLVINNALCSYLIKHKSKRIKINARLTAQASCPIGWANPHFAIALHEAFLRFLNQNENLTEDSFDVSLSRFSINCIGFFGSDVIELGDLFCPVNVDDEEWISAVLPLLTKRKGRILGQSIVSHYSFYIQESLLNETDILDKYYAFAGVSRKYPLPKSKRTSSSRSKFRRFVSKKLVELGLKKKKKSMVDFFNS